MATRWHLSLRGWVQSFRAWLGDPQAENLVNLQVFVDFRPVAGALSLEPRERVVDSIRGVTAALSYMARSCTRFVVPLGPFRSLRARGGRLDIKTGLVVPMVCAARVLALTAGSRARNTFLRLRAAAEAGLLAREDAGAAEEAFAFGLRLRLEHQLREVLRRLDATLREGVLVVHGGHVDLPLLQRAYADHQMPWPRTPVVDTMRLLQCLEHRLRWLSGSPIPRSIPLDLTEARQHLGLPPYPRHDAGSDAVATAELFIALAARLGARTVKDLVRWGGFS